MILYNCIFYQIPNVRRSGTFYRKYLERNFIKLLFIEGYKFNRREVCFFVPFCDKKIDKNTSTCKNKKGDILNTELSKTLTIAEAKEQQELMEVISGEIPCQHLWKLMKVIAKN